jgi:hypothetical protein
MSLSDPLDVLIIGILLAIMMGLVGWFTRGSIDFRSGRNKEARKNFKSTIEKASRSRKSQQSNSP